MIIDDPFERVLWPFPPPLRSHDTQAEKLWSKGTTHLKETWDAGGFERRTTDKWPVSRQTGKSLNLNRNGGRIMSGEGLPSSVRLLEITTSDPGCGNQS